MARKKSTEAAAEAVPDRIACEIAYLPMPLGGTESERFSPAFALHWLHDELPEWITLAAVGATNASDEQTRLDFEGLAREVAKVARAFAEGIRQEEPVCVITSDKHARPLERRAALARMLRAFVLDEAEVDSIADQTRQMTDELVKLCTSEAA